MAITVYLVEDDLEFSEILLEILDANPLFTLMGHATSIDAARNFIYHNEPDLFIVNLSLHDGSGIELISYIKSRPRYSKILAMSNVGDKKHILGSLNAGASGFLLKSESPDTLEQSIISLITHGSYLSPHASRLVIYELKSVICQMATQENRANPHHLFERSTAAAEYRYNATLTPKEQQVIPLLAAGMPTKLIANQLSVSPFTINQHLRSIYRKLKARNKMEAVFKARELGLL